MLSLQTQGERSSPDPGEAMRVTFQAAGPHLYEGLVRCGLKVPSVPRAKLRAVCHSCSLKLQLQPPKKGVLAAQAEMRWFLLWNRAEGSDSEGGRRGSPSPVQGCLGCPGPLLLPSSPLLCPCFFWGAKSGEAGAFEFQGFKSLLMFPPFFKKERDLKYRPLY